METVQPVIRGQVSTALVRVSNSSTIQVGGGQLRTYYSYTIYKFQFQFQFVAVIIVFSSLDIKFHELYRSIFPFNPFITTDPDLNVISCGRRQLYIEPWW